MKTPPNGPSRRTPARALEGCQGRPAVIELVPSTPASPGGHGFPTGAVRESTIGRRPSTGHATAGSFARRADPRSAISSSSRSLPNSHADPLRNRRKARSIVADFVAWSGFSMRWTSLSATSEIRGMRGVATHLPRGTPS